MFHFLHRHLLQVYFLVQHFAQRLQTPLHLQQNKEMSKNYHQDYLAEDLQVECFLNLLLKKIL